MILEFHSIVFLKKMLIITYSNKEFLIIQWETWSWTKWKTEFVIAVWKVKFSNSILESIKFEKVINKFSCDTIFKDKLINFIQETPLEYPTDSKEALS